MKRFLIWLFLALPMAAQNATLINATAGTNTASMSTTGANLFVVCRAEYSVFPPTDSSGNTYTLVTSQQADAGVGMYVSFNPTTSGSTTFTSDVGSGIAAMAFSNIATGIPDKVTSAQGTSAGSFTPTNSNEPVVSCPGASSFPTAFSVNSPLTLAAGGTSTAQWGTAVGYQIQGGTASAVNPTWNLTGGFEPVTLAASFYSLTAPGALIITTASLNEGFVGVAYNQQMTATGGVAPYTWTLLSGTFPTGLSMSSGGLISGTPTVTASATSLQFKVTDAHSTTQTVTLPLTVAATQLAITTTTCQKGKQLTTYGGCTIAATGGTTPYVYSYATGPPNSTVSIPEGLSLNSSTGVMSGTVAGQGIYQVNFQATDAVGSTVTQQINVPIDGDNTFGGTSLFPVGSIYHGVNVTGLPKYTGPGAAPLVTNIHIVFGQYVFYDGGLPIWTVPSTQANLPFNCAVSPNCFQVPLAFTSGPMSSVTPVEGSPNNITATDAHSLVVQLVGGGNHAMLWESYSTNYVATPSPNFVVSSDATWDLTGYFQYPMGYGTTDAAGLPVTPLLANYDLVTSANGQQTPFRFTLQESHLLKYYFWPATARPPQYGGGCTGGFSDPTNSGQLRQNNPPSSCNTDRTALGVFYRITAAAFASPPNSCLTDTVGHPQAASIWKTLRNYGMVNADLGTDDGLVGTADNRWNDTDLSCLTNIPGSAFEPVDLSSIIVSYTTSQTNYTAPTSATVSGKAVISGRAVLQ